MKNNNKIEIIESSTQQQPKKRTNSKSADNLKIAREVRKKKIEDEKARLEFLTKHKYNIPSDDEISSSDDEIVVLKAPKGKLKKKLKNLPPPDNVKVLEKQVQELTYAMQKLNESKESRIRKKQIKEIEKKVNDEMPKPSYNPIPPSKPKNDIAEHMGLRILQF